jgi:hypothetical protein
MRPSAKALRRIAATLRLTDNERAYLSFLTEREDRNSAPRRLSEAVARLNPIQRILDAFAATPGILYDSRFDVVAGHTLPVCGGVLQKLNCYPGASRDVTLATCNKDAPDCTRAYRRSGKGREFVRSGDLRVALQRSGGGYAMTKYWIGVASRDHVRIGAAGGFCQLCHGKAAPLRRLKVGDRIIYYSPGERMPSGAPVQAFTAIGEVAAGEPEAHNMGGGFVPYRRDVAFYKASDAPIKPLLPLLSFTRDRPQWGIVLRRGIFAIDRMDYDIIADAMDAAQR